MAPEVPYIQDSGSVVANFTVTDSGNRDTRVQAGLIGGFVLLMYLLFAIVVIICITRRRQHRASDDVLKENGPSSAMLEPMMFGNSSHRHYGVDFPANNPIFKHHQTTSFEESPKSTYDAPHFPNGSSQSILRSSQSTHISPKLINGSLHFIASSPQSMHDSPQSIEIRLSPNLMRNGDILSSPKPLVRLPSSFMKGIGVDSQSSGSQNADASRRRNTADFKSSRPKSFVLFSKQDAPPVPRIPSWAISKPRSAPSRTSRKKTTQLQSPLVVPDKANETHRGPLNPTSLYAGLPPGAARPHIFAHKPRRSFITKSTHRSSEVSPQPPEPAGSSGFWHASSFGRIFKP